VYFACQTAGLGIHGQTVTGCGQSQLQAAIPEAPWAPALLLGAGAVALLSGRRLRRRPPLSG
jgi:hypothetical protein